MITQITLEEKRAVRSVFVVAYVKFGQTRLMFLPDASTPAVSWESKPLMWLGRDTLNDGRTDRLAFNPDLAWVDKVERITVFAFTEQAYAVSSAYTVENMFDSHEHHFPDEPREGATICGMPVKTGYTLMVDYIIDEDNSEQQPGPTFASFAEAQASLGLPDAFAA